MDLDGTPSLRRTDGPWLITPPSGRHHSFPWQLSPGARAAWQEGGSEEGTGDEVSGQGIQSSVALTVLFVAKLCSEAEIAFANKLFNTGSLWGL